MFTPISFQQPQLVTSGLVLYLDAADRTSYPAYGNIWRDLAWGNNGTLTNGPTFNNGNGGSIVFDGTNDYVLVNSGSTSINPTTAITVASFFNISSYSANYAPICFKQNNYSGNYEQYSLFLSNTAVGFVVSSAGGNPSNQYLAISNADYRNQFIYAVGTCDTLIDQLKLYINGNLIQTVAFPATFDIADTPLNIGGTGVLKFGATYAGFANGKIYSTQIYNRALSAAEITQNFNAQRQRFNI